ncbi:MAG: ABC transporter permease [Balneolales bacterium]
MRTIRFLLQKEFLQIFRNRAMLPILFVLPIVQLLVLSFAATYDLKKVDFALVDMDQSTYSKQLSSKFQASGHFILRTESFSKKQALKEIDKGNVNMVMHIPLNFQRDLLEGQPVEVQLNIDAVDGSTAGLIQSYGISIINDYNKEKSGVVRLLGNQSRDALQSVIHVKPQYWYNPDLNYITYMVPGILVVLVSMIGLFLSGMNIVREQEIGTIEQLNVTPIRKYQFIAGKLIPFWIIGMIDLLIGLALARYGFKIPFLGSIITILIIASIYLIVVQAVGLFISTVTNTQQQAMFIAWFIMVVFILMGGLFTPIESMPEWAQIINIGNPVAHFIEIMRMVLLKGAGWSEVRHMVAILAGMGSLFLSISINRYRKTTI